MPSADLYLQILVFMGACVCSNVGRCQRRRILIWARHWIETGTLGQSRLLFVGQSFILTTCIFTEHVFLSGRKMKKESDTKHTNHIPKSDSVVQYHPTPSPQVIDFVSHTFRESSPPPDLETYHHLLILSESWEYIVSGHLQISSSQTCSYLFTKCIDTKLNLIVFSNISAFWFFPSMRTLLAQWWDVKIDIL